MEDSWYFTEMGKSSYGYSGRETLLQGDAVSADVMN
jgi:hypothetical protein